jgi:hypothetical protein
LSLKALPPHIAIVDRTREVPPAKLQEWSGALNEQISVDVGPAWDVAGTFGAYDEPPAGTWALEIDANLNEPGALGYHSDNQGTPYAKVQYQGDGDETSQTLSHEAVEMIIDPFGMRLHGGRIPATIEDYEQFGLRHPHSHVQYLLEACDPPEVKAYYIGNVAVSDFILKGWYYPLRAAFRSYTGYCSAALQVADGGYVSFKNPVTHEWYQVFNESDDLAVESIGQFDKTKHFNYREFTDHHARLRRNRAR